VSQALSKAWRESLAEARVAILVLEIITAEASDSVLDHGELFPATAEMLQFACAMTHLAVQIKAASVQEELAAAAVLASVPRPMV
jgi:hypothetical protein